MLGLSCLDQTRLTGFAKGELLYKLLTKEVF